MTTENLLFREHTVYYQNTYVQPPIDITNIRADFPSQTFAVADITSVSMAEFPLKKPFVLIGSELIVVGLLCGATITVAFPGIAFSAIAGLVALLFLCAGIWVISLSKPKYAVKIATASGISNALVSTDRRDIECIVMAIHKAMDERD